MVHFLYSQQNPVQKAWVLRSDELGGRNLSWIKSVVKIPRGSPAEGGGVVQESFGPFAELFLVGVGAVADFEGAVEPFEEAGTADAGDDFGFTDVVGQDR